MNKTERCNSIRRTLITQLKSFSLKFVLKSLDIVNKPWLPGDKAQVGNVFLGTSRVVDDYSVHSCKGAVIDRAGGVLNIVLLRFLPDFSQTRKRRDTLEVAHSTFPFSRVPTRQTRRFPNNVTTSTNDINLRHERIQTTISINDISLTNKL
jgi:hypothetical protein